MPETEKPKRVPTVHVEPAYQREHGKCRMRCNLCLKEEEASA